MEQKLGPSFTLREVTSQDAGALAHVLINGIHTAFRGIVPERCLKFTAAESAANWRQFLEDGLDPGDFMVVVQAADGEIVGYAWGGPSDADPDYRGELKQLVILPAYQRQGIGSALVRIVATRLAEQGIQTLWVEVLRDNPNRPFYERLGGKHIGQRPYDWDGFPMQMYAYGWRDTRVLLERDAAETSLPPTGLEETADGH